MNIQDALEETGMAKRVDGGNEYGWYAKVKNGILKGFSEGGFVGGMDISFDHIGESDWQPYHPEPTKCPACIRRIDFGEEYEGVRLSKSAENTIWILEQLCTCKKED